MGGQILIVDDEQDVREFLKNLVEDHGYRAGLAQDGVVALEKIKEAKPDLILLDLQMPEETGTGLYRKLQHNAEFKDIPVIVISGLAGRHVAVGKSVAVFDKPIDEDGLLAEIAKIIG